MSSPHLHATCPPQNETTEKPDTTELVTIYARDEVECPPEMWPRNKTVTAPGPAKKTTGPNFPCKLTEAIIEAKLQYIAGAYDHANAAGDEQPILKDSYIADHSCRNLIETFERGRQAGVDLRTREMKQTKTDFINFKRKTKKEIGVAKREE